MKLVGDDHDAVVVRHKSFRRILERVANALVDLARRAQEGSDIGFEQPRTVLVVNEPKCFSGNYCHRVIVLCCLAGDVDARERGTTHLFEVHDKFVSRLPFGPVPVEALDVHYFELDGLPGDLSRLEILRLCLVIGQDVHPDLVEVRIALLDGEREGVRVV